MPYTRDSCSFYFIQICPDLPPCPKLTHFIGTEYHDSLSIAILNTIMSNVPLAGSISPIPV